MKRISQFRWLPAMLCGTLVACAGEPSAPQFSSTPQYSQTENHGVGNGQEHEPFPNLDGVARYKGGAPSWSANQNHTVIGAAGGTLRVADFQMIIPAGALDHNTQFHIVLPTDAKEKSRAAGQFGPHMMFNKDITIVLPYAATDAKVAQIVWWDEGKWVAIPTSVCDGGKRLCGRTNHFSVYATWKGVIALGG